MPVKILGFILITAAATLMGFYKAMQLRQRYQKLSFLYGALLDLRERIKINSGEIDRLVSLSFKTELIKTDASFMINPVGLEKSDTALMTEFFSNIGMSEAEAECERIGLYMSILSAKCSEAEKKCTELCRLYTTSGFLCGVFICIFFL